MTFPLQKIDLGPPWRGLYARTQRTLEDGELYAANCHNLEFFEGTLRTRGGSRIINGWGSYALAGWVANNGSGRAQGLVKDASGFRVGDELQIVDVNGAVYQTSIFALAGNLVTLSVTTSPALTANAALYTARGFMQFPGEVVDIPGLYQARFRDGVEVLLAYRVIDGQPNLMVIAEGEAYRLLDVPFQAPMNLPQTEIDTWPTGTLGTLDSIEGIEVGDRIYVRQLFEQRRVSVVNNVTGQVTVSPPFSSAPANGDDVLLFPFRTEETGLNAIFAAFGNWVYVVLNGYAPLLYGHVKRFTLKAGWTTTSGDVVEDPTALLTFPDIGFGRDVVLVTDKATGRQAARHVTNVAGFTVTLGSQNVSFGIPNDLPFVPSEGSTMHLIRNYRVGIKPPASPIQTSLGGAGAVSGARSFRVKFRSTITGAESEPSPPSTPITPTNQLVNLTVPVSVDPQADVKDIYSTVAGGDGVWYYAKTIPNATTATTWNSPDTSLGSLMREFLDETPPDTLTTIVPWPQALRLIGIAAGDDFSPPRVVFSDAPDLKTGTLRGTSWPADNFLLIGLDSGDEPVALAPFFDSVLVFCRRSIWRISGTPPDLEIQPVNYRADNTGIGTFGPRAVVVDQNEVLFPSQDGWYLINRYEGSGDSGFQSERISREIDTLWALTVHEEASLPQLHATFFRQRRQLRAWTPVIEGTAPSLMLLFHFDSDLDGTPFGWATWILAAAGLSAELTPEQQVQASAVGLGNPDKYFVATRFGSILELDVNDGGVDPGLLDHGGLVYPQLYQTTPFAPGGIGGISRGRMLDLIWSALGTATALEVGISCGFDPGSGFNAVLALPASTATGHRFERLPLLARGQYHVLTLLNGTFNAMMQLQRMAYWFQRLPIPAQIETTVQSEPID